MRTILFAFTFCLFTLASTAQHVRNRFDHACNLYQEKKYETALSEYLNIYNKGIGNPELVYRSYYLAGLIYLKTNDNRAAKRVYRDILDTDFDGYEANAGLWDKPFSEMKHYSCKILGELSLEQKDYSEAFRFFSMADKEYPFIHFCGNEHEANAILLARMYAKCYVGFGDKEKAIQMLLPFCLSNHFADNSEAANELVALLKEKYSKYELRKQIANARAGLHIEQPYNQPWFAQAFVTIFGTKIAVPESYSWQNKDITNKLKGKALYQYFFDEEEFVKKLLQ